MTIVQQVAVSVSPSTAQVDVGAQQQFTATVTGTAVTGVTWSVTGTGCVSVHLRYRFVDRTLHRPCHTTEPGTGQSDGNI